MKVFDVGGDSWHGFTIVYTVTNVCPLCLSLCPCLVLSLCLCLCPPPLLIFFLSFLPMGKVWSLLDWGKTKCPSRKKSDYTSFSITNVSGMSTAFCQSSVIFGCRGFSNVSTRASVGSVTCAFSLDSGNVSKRKLLPYVGWDKIAHEDRSSSQ